MTDIPYPYSVDVVGKLVDAISTERFQTYLIGAGGQDATAAIQRYMWNASVASRFQGPLHLLEVALRNAVHGRMTERYGAAWFDLNHLFGPERGAIADAKAFLTKRNESVSPGKIVAELSFRFWVALFASKYHSLWKTDLARLFTPRLVQVDLHDDLDRLRTLRNRIAHHEPVFNRKLMDDLSRIDRTLHALSPQMADWLRWHQRADVAYGTPTDQVCTF